MAKIVLSLDGVIVKELLLAKERITIGRRPHNDLVIESSAISAEHAVFITILGDTCLEDLNSTNGTRVNGQPIKKHYLRNGDVVELAKYKMCFIDDAQAKSDREAYAELSHRPSGVLNTINARSTQVADAHRDGNTVLLGAPVASAGAIIKILNGANAGKEITLSKPLTTIGRPGQQVAVVTRRGLVYSLTHVEGLSCPLVNGKSIGTNAYVMTEGDVIELSDTQMVFLLL